MAKGDFFSKVCHYFRSFFQLPGFPQAERVRLARRVTVLYCTTTISNNV